MTDPGIEFENLPRVLGAYDPTGPSTATDGPEGERLLVFLGGLHGNEPAGVRAIRIFFEQLEAFVEGTTEPDPAQVDAFRTRSLSWREEILR